MTTQSADTPRAESITLVPRFEGQHMCNGHYYHIHIVTLIIYHLITFLLSEVTLICFASTNCVISTLQFWTYALYRLLACYSGSGAGSLLQPLHASVCTTLNTRHHTFVILAQHCNRVCRTCFLTVYQQKHYLCSRSSRQRAFNRHSKACRSFAIPCTQ